MTKLEKRLQQICDGVGLKIDFGFAAICPNGHEIRAIARIRGVGAANGMLVMGDYDEVENHLECLRSSGYGFTVFGEPSDNEQIDWNSVREMFDEWGWVSDPET